MLFIFIFSFLILYKFFYIDLLKHVFVIFYLRYEASLAFFVLVFFQHILPRAPYIMPVLFY